MSNYVIPLPIQVLGFNFTRLERLKFVEFITLSTI